MTIKTIKTFSVVATTAQDISANCKRNMTQELETVTILNASSVEKKKATVILQLIIIRKKYKLKNMNNKNLKDKLCFELLGNNTTYKKASVCIRDFDLAGFFLSGL